jgi:hypothetical protein
VTTTAAFQDGKPLGIREHKVFGAAFPTAQRFVCLRINRAVATPTARLTTGLLGSALAGRDSHPLDDKLNFPNRPSVRSFQTSVAWSHCHAFAATARVQPGIGVTAKA